MNNLSLALTLGNSRGLLEARISISATTTPENTSIGSTVGVLSVISGEGSYTFSIISDPDNKFELFGSDLRTKAALDFETATSHSVTVQADNGVDTPITRVFTVTVTNVFEQPSLAALTLASTVDQGATLTITGATAGSTITGTMPTGWTLDGPNRQIAVASNAPLGPQNWSLSEELNDSPNSPNPSSGTTTVQSTLVLGDTSLASSQIAEDQIEDAVVGAIQGSSGSTFTLDDDAGGRFKIVAGNVVLGATALDFDTDPTHNIDIREDNPSASNSGRVTTVTITVTNVFEAPTLGTLTLAGTVTQGGTLAIQGATIGSTIAGTTLPTGWTLDGPNRQIAVASDATLGSQSWSLTETLADSSNSPNTSTGSTLVEASTPASNRPLVVIALLGQSKMSGHTALGAQDVDVAGIYQFGGQILETATYEQITADITPLLHPRTEEAANRQLGVGDYFGRQLHQRLLEIGLDPAIYDILLVPCARGGTSLVVGDEEWKPTAPLGFLLQNAIDRCTNAVNAAKAIDSASFFAGFAWDQGGNDANLGATEEAYFTAFNQLVSQMRTNVPTAQDCWVMMGSILPELSKGLPGAPAIEAAHRRAALEGNRIYYQQGPAGFNLDAAHYTAAGSRLQGAAMADELVARLADPALSYDFVGQEIDDTNIIGATQRGGTNFTIRDGTGSGAAAKSLTATGTATLPELGTTGLRFEGIDDLADMQIEWSSNTDGQQAVTLRASGTHSANLGPDGYLVGIDGSGAGSVGLFLVSGGTTGVAVAGSTDLGLTGSTARFRASVLGTTITFDVSQDDGTTWTQAFTHTATTFSSGDLVYMQGGNGTTGNEVFAYDFVVRNIAPAVTLGALALPASVEQGQLVAIAGATAGSTITATTLPTGWTLDSAARTISIASDAPLGAQSWALSEVLAGATNTPNPSSGSSTVGVSTGFSFTNIEASNYVAAMTVAPNNTRKGAIDQLVTALKTANLFAKMDALWLADAHDDQAARLNLINPAANVITGNATFAAGTGFTGNTSNDLDTGFALDGGTNYSDTSASIFVHSPAFNSSTGSIFGYASGTDITFSPATDAGGWFGRMGDGVGGTPSFSAGLSVLTYDNGTSRAYNNGTLGDTDTRDRRDVTPSENLTLLGASGIFSGYTISSAGVASGLSAAEIADLDTALTAYRTAIGGS